MGVLAMLGFNELQLYVGHTFAYSDHEDEWRESSAFTAEDMQWPNHTSHKKGIDFGCPRPSLSLVTLQSAWWPRRLNQQADPLAP